MNNFCERFILHYNRALRDNDLMLLDILSEKYNIVNYGKLILNRDISSIISRIIIDTIPYRFGEKLVFDNNLFTIIALVGEDKIIYPSTKSLEGQEYIDKEIERMNAFIKLKLIENGR